MSGVRVIFLASFLLAMALIFSCGEYPEIPYENRIVGDVQDPGDGTSADSGPSSGSGEEPPPQDLSSSSTPFFTPDQSSQSVDPESSPSSSQSVVVPSSSSTSCLVQPGDVLIDPRDGISYETVQICTQTWMAKNLNYNYGSSSCYGDVPANCETYGRMYNYNAAMDACPSGWHLPSLDEWADLINYAGGMDAAGAKLKAAIGWDGGENGSDDYSFAALPGGNMSGTNFINIGSYGFWWTSTPENSYSAYHISMAKSSRVSSASTPINNGRSVRCIKGIGPLGTPSSSSVGVASPSSSSVKYPLLIWDLEMGGGVSTGGGWYDYNDADEFGNSTTDLACNETSCPWIDDKSGGISFNFVPFQSPNAMSHTGGYISFAGVGFTWRDGNAYPEVFGSSIGICVEYALSGIGNFTIKIATPGDIFGYDDFRIVLPKQAAVKKTFFNFNSFAQEGWGSSGTITQAKNNSTGINFQGNLETKYIGDATGSAILTLKSVSLVSSANQCIN